MTPEASREEPAADCRSNSNLVIIRAAALLGLPTSR